MTATYQIRHAGLLTLLIVVAGHLSTVAAQTTEPVCAAHIPSSVTMNIDGDTAGDWDAFTPQTIELDGSGDYTTLLAADGTHLYFYTEVEDGDFSDLPAQAFLIGVAPDRMLQIQPFDAGDAPGQDDKNFDNNDFSNNFGFGGTWDDSWTLPTASTTDFHRVLDTTAPIWQLEGRIPLTNLGIGDRNDFDVFLHISSGATGADDRYWPSGPPSDLGDPSTVDFGENRCPEVAFSEPYLSFGKAPLNTTQNETITILNDGVAGSELEVAGASLSGDAAFTLASITKDAGGASPPFALSDSETATAQIQYHASAPSTITSPHVAVLSVDTNDPDADDVPAEQFIQGNARVFLDNLFILDQSGSMLDEDKWPTTEWAAEVAYEAMRLFSMSQDRVGAVWFGGTSSSPDADVLTTLDFFPSSPTSFQDKFSQDAQNNFWTPIGFGLEEGHDGFGTAADRANIGLLMSDGLHNRPTSTSDATTVEGLDLPTAVFDNDKDMHIHTIALGSDANVSTDLLDDIRDHYQVAASTTAPPSTYNITEDAADLADLFVEPLMEPFIVNRVAFDGAVNGYPIDASAGSALGMVVWEQGLTPADIKVQAFDATGTNLLQVYDSGSSGYHKGSGTNQPFTYIFIEDAGDLVQNPVWRFCDDSGSPETCNPISASNGTPLALVDLDIIAVFDAQQLVEGTGNEYMLTAKVTEAGRPVTNTAEQPVEVTARLTRPGEGFGDLVSTISLEDCEAHEPTLPDPIVIDAQAGDPGANIQLPQAAGQMRTAALAPRRADPAGYKYSWADAYFERCNRDGLLRLEEPGLQLRDDGTQGDEVANDGIYTLRFADTEYEGTYVVRFAAQGTSPAGSRFARRRTLSTYVPIAIDPEVTLLDWRVYSEFDDVSIFEYYVTPQDRFRRYMGPGRADRVRFDIVGGGGEIVSDVMDYNNGIYSVLIRHEQGEPRPEVEATVQGEVIGPDRPGRSGTELGLYANGYQFDDALNLDIGYGFGGWLGFPLFNSPLYGELEFGVTLTNFTDTDTFRVAQGLGNLRLDLTGFSAGPFVPHLTAGAGFARFFGEGDDETAFVYHGGGGLSLFFSPRFALRGTLRAFTTGEVRGSGGPTTNLQLYVGILFRRP